MSLTLIWRARISFGQVRSGQIAIRRSGFRVGEGIIDTERVVVDSGSAVSAVPRLAEGIELIGEYQGSGFLQAPYIVRRVDGQVIQLPRLLYLLAASVDGRRDHAQIASALTA